jgi:hypothetical protein
MGISITLGQTSHFTMRAIPVEIFSRLTGNRQIGFIPRLKFPSSVRAEVEFAKNFTGGLIASGRILT